MKGASTDHKGHTRKDQKPPKGTDTLLRRQDVRVFDTAGNTNLTPTHLCFRGFEIEFSEAR